MAEEISIPREAAGAAARAAPGALRDTGAAGLLPEAAVVRLDASAAAAPEETVKPRALSGTGAASGEPEAGGAQFLLQGAVAGRLSLTRCES